jgi:DNA repair exonuclease SbcCD nuclease subunit
VKHLARKKKFGVRDRLAEIISETEQMWGKAVIRPSDAEEVRQESAPSGEESIEERNEDVSTPRDEAFVEDLVEEGTPRTPSSEHPGTPPPHSPSWGECLPSF